MAVTGSTVFTKVVHLSHARVSDHAAFKNFFGQVRCAKTECDRARQDSPPCDAKAHHDDVLGKTHRGMHWTEAAGHMPSGGGETVDE